MREQLGSSPQLRRTRSSIAQDGRFWHRIRHVTWSEMPCDGNRSASPSPLMNGSRLFRKLEAGPLMQICTADLAFMPSVKKELRTWGKPLLPGLYRQPRADQENSSRERIFSKGLHSPPGAHGGRYGPPARSAGDSPYDRSTGGNQEQRIPVLRCGLVSGDGSLPRRDDVPSHAGNLRIFGVPVRLKLNFSTRFAERTG